MTSNDNERPTGGAPTYSWTAPDSFSGPTGGFQQPGPAQPAPTQPGPAQPEPAQPGSAQADQAQAGGYQHADEARTGGAQPGYGAAGYGAAGYGAAGYSQPGQHGLAAQPGQPGQHGQPGQPGYGPAPSGTPGGPGDQGPHGPYGPHGPEQPHPPRRERKGKPWLMVGTAAVLAAVLASGGTALVMQDDAPAGNNQALVQVPSSPTNVASSSDGSPDWEAVADAVRPSVVAIDVATARGEAAGSGVIIDADHSYILTNNHVVDGARQIAVALYDGRMFSAEVVGTDPATDLAVLQLTNPPDDLQAATLGTSEDLQVGQSVMAVGNPLGLSSTVTTGIISALNRPVSTTDEFSRQQVVTNAIQIDAAINPGNSGGPLFDASGHVIGITSSIASTGQNAGSIGLGFAIPVDLVTTIADQLIQSGAAEHAYLGVTLTDGTAKVGEATRVGAQVHQVMADTPAAAAGLQPGDVIIKIDDHTVGGAESLTGYVRTYSSGDKVTLTVVRDGQQQEITATLATREDVAS